MGLLEDIQAIPPQRGEGCLACKAVEDQADEATRAALAEEQVRAREVTLDLQASLQAQYRQECKVISEEPRLKAVVATEDVARETVLDTVRDLAKTLNASAFAITGRSERSNPDASGSALSAIR